MNNCPKCGNPLQVGVTSCPICGTNVASTSSGGSVEPVKQTISVSQVSEAQNPVSVAQPVSPAPVSVQPSTTSTQPVAEQQNNQTASNKIVASVAIPSQTVNSVPNQVQPITTENPVQAQTLPVEPNVLSTSVQSQTQQVSIPVEQVVSTSIPVSQSVSVATAEVSSTSQVNPPQQVQPTSVQEQVVQPVSQTPIVPISITPTVESAPIPGIPTSLTGGVVQAPEVQNIEQPKGKVKKEKNKESKIGNKKPFILVAAVALVIVVAVFLYMMFGSNFKLKPNNQPNEEEALAMSSVVSHGFKFGLQDGWQVSEDQNNVIVTNLAETVSIRFSQSPTSLTDITEDIINTQLSRNTNFSNTKVGTTQIGARDSFVVDATLNETLPVQIYFISGGSALTLGVTIIYQSSETKDKLESSILEMIGSISYSDDSIKAISTISMYSEAFNMFNNVVTNKQPDVPEEPIESDPNNQGEEQNPTNPTPGTENGENPTLPETPVSENPAEQQPAGN